MVAELDDWIKGYLGKQARVYCLAQIINLVVKSILNQFNSQKPRKGTNGAEIVDTEGDNIEGWIEEPTGAGARAKTEPVRLMLVKVATSIIFVPGVELNPSRSFATLYVLSRDQLVFDNDGIKLYRVKAYRSERYPVTWRPGGTPPTTCYAWLSNTKQPSRLC
jgi:hypothetical protein